MQRKSRCVSRGEKGSALVIALFVMIILLPARRDPASPSRAPSTASPTTPSGSRAPSTLPRQDSRPRSAGSRPTRAPPSSWPRRNSRPGPTTTSSGRHAGRRINSQGPGLQEDAERARLFPGPRNGYNTSGGYFFDSYEVNATGSGQETPAATPDAGRIWPHSPMRCAMCKKLLALVLTVSLLGLPVPSVRADDSDIFGANIHPNVLLALDTSGSMGRRDPVGPVRRRPAPTTPAPTIA